MNKPLYFILFLLKISIVFPLSAQTDELVQVLPLWKLNDERKIITESITKITINDSLVTDVNVKAEYKIKVLDTVKYFTLEYSQKSGQLGMDMNSNMPLMDSAATVIMKVIKKIEEKMSTLPYHILVDKQTGLAFEVKNSKDLMKIIGAAAQEMLVDLGTKKGKSKAEIDSVVQVINKMLKEKEPQLLQSVINSVNYVLQAYSFTFPLNGSVSQETMVYNSNPLGDFGDTEFPAIMTVQSKEGSGNTLLVSTSLDYDKKFMLEQIRKKHKDFSKLTTSDIIIVEKNEIVFDMETTWIKKHTSEVLFEMPKVKTLNKTVMLFN